MKKIILYYQTWHKELGIQGFFQTKSKGTLQIVPFTLPIDFTSPTKDFKNFKNAEINLVLDFDFGWQETIIMPACTRRQAESNWQYQMEAMYPDFQNLHLIYQQKQIGQEIRNQICFLYHRQLVMHEFIKLKRSLQKCNLNQIPSLFTIFPDVLLRNVKTMEKEVSIVIYIQKYFTRLVFCECDQITLYSVIPFGLLHDPNQILKEIILRSHGETNRLKDGVVVIITDPIDQEIVKSTLTPLFIKLFSPSPCIFYQSDNRLFEVNNPGNKSFHKQANLLWKEVSNEKTR